MQMWTHTQMQTEGKNKEIRNMLNILQNWDFEGFFLFFYHKTC